MTDVTLKLPADLSRTARPRCPYFGTCGGCALQDVEYAEQVKAKAAALRELFGADVPVVPSPLPYNYRHKMEYVAAFGKLGFRRTGDYRQVVDLRECHLVPPRISELLGDLHRWIAEFGVEGYDYMRHQGDLRYVVTRQAVTCNLSPVTCAADQLMVTLVTAGTQTRVGALLERLAHKAESVVWATNPHVADVACGQVQRIIGVPHIRQRVGRFEFLLGPDSFFQNNLLLVEAMFGEIAGHVSGRVLDLFCGVGSIGIYCAERATEIIGVDSKPESIDLARRNAELNGLTESPSHLGARGSFSARALAGKPPVAADTEPAGTSCGFRFVAQDADGFVRSYAGPVPDTVIVDPPRRGLSPRLIRKLLRLGAGRIVYVSCNPLAFAGDLPRLSNYRLTSIKAFDMFPQTPHVELVAALERAAYPPLKNRDSAPSS
jgi:tRNA (uracil-5-)-methyltransferase